MINSKSLTNHDCSEADLQELILFGIASSNVNKDSAANKFNDLMDKLGYGRLYTKPFQVIKAFGSQQNLMGCIKRTTNWSYQVKSRGMWWITHAGLDLRNCTCEQLEQCPGIGFKTSREFITRTRRNPVPQVIYPNERIRSFIAGYEGNSTKAKIYTNPSHDDLIELEKKFITIADEIGKTALQLANEINEDGFRIPG